jgi:hypothetical protein
MSKLLWRKYNGSLGILYLSKQKLQKPLIVQQTCVEVAKALHTNIIPFYEIELASESSHGHISVRVFELGVDVGLQAMMFYISTAILTLTNPLTSKGNFQHFSK